MAEKSRRSSTRRPSRADSAADAGQEALLGVAVPSHVGLHEARRVAADGGERGAQLMAEPGQEAALKLLGTAQGGRPPGGPARTPPARAPGAGSGPRPRSDGVVRQIVVGRWLLPGPSLTSAPSPRRPARKEGHRAVRSVEGDGQMPSVARLPSRWPVPSCRRRRARPRRNASAAASASAGAIPLSLAPAHADDLVRRAAEQPDLVGLQPVAQRLQREEEAFSSGTGPGQGLEDLPDGLEDPVAGGDLAEQAFPLDRARPRSRRRGWPGRARRGRAGPRRGDTP